MGNPNLLPCHDPVRGYDQTPAASDADFRGPGLCGHYSGCFLHCQYTGCRHRRPGHDSQWVQYIPFHPDAHDGLHPHPLGFCGADSLLLLQESGEAEYHRAVKDRVKRKGQI